MISFIPLRRWSGRVRIPLAYPFRCYYGGDGSAMLHKSSRRAARLCGAVFVNRGPRTDHPILGCRGVRLACAILVVQGIQTVSLANLAGNPAKARTLSTPNPHRLPSTIAREDEHLLVAAAKSGDAAAFEELVNRYERKIFRLTMNITRNREDAEDSMQDAFMKAYSHLGSFQEDSRFYTWLVRIAANEALMRLRKRRPNQFSLDEPVAGDEDLMPREIADWGPSPEQRYAQTEMHEILSEVIDKLEPDFRVVFVLRDIEELSTEETAKTLGISVPAVKSRLLRARLALREKLTRQFKRKGEDLLGNL